MARILALFWNREEKRLRSGIRVVLQLTIFFILMKSLSSLFKIPNTISGEEPVSTFILMAIVRLFRVLISVYIAGRFLDRRSFSDFGLRLSKRWWIDMGFGLTLGMVLMSCVFLTELSLGSVKITEFSHISGNGNGFLTSLFVFLILFICVGFSEELLGRGYLLMNLAEGFNFKSIAAKWSVLIGLILSSLIFGAFHLGSPEVGFISIFILIMWALLSGLAYILTGRLGMSIGLHITWNFFQGNISGFPVSGTTFSSEKVTLISIEQSGPDLWTGGAYGPESGLIGLCAIIGGAILVLIWVRQREGRLAVQILPKSQSAI